MPQVDATEYVTYQRSYQQERYESRLAWARTELGGICVGCGTSKELQFDHIDPATKFKKVVDMTNYSMARFTTEVHKCQLLCLPCHVKKTREDRKG